MSLLRTLLLRTLSLLRHDVRNRHRLAVIFAALALLMAFADVELAPQLLERMSAKYGDAARTRLLDWQQLLARPPSDVRSTLTTVNNFFNQVEFIPDDEHWQQKDYWATPVEFLASNGGDCEDFSIAKYMTLIALGVPEAQLRITYVKAVELNQAHMVLTWYEKPDAEPLVLDNLIGDIRPASQRTDLVPVYSFNGADLWLAKERGAGQLVGSSERISPWRELLARLARDFKKAPFLAPGKP
ncbi:transglutaminase-like cysteine peptidase [Permianibacter fluminis]|uniref:transglutaminase-like cysteine peptidase n=1 Tax=Permianibacter fluminis TaxID=2738515 RepID=UPI001F33C3E2|nr:transglutaminase-like cysteine peptidase [Permianibacter fluminis]